MSAFADRGGLLAAYRSQRRRRSQFRPCIDLHDGVVKQIVGGTLDLDAPATAAHQDAAAAASSSELKTNFVAELPSSHFARMYRRDGLRGGHVIKLGKGNDAAAREALAAWPGGLQVGGGITLNNAQDWLNAGAEKIIITSALFPGGVFDEGLLRAFAALVGRDRLVVDISCRRREAGWVVAMNGWKTLTDLAVTAETIARIEQHCAELLVHAADVEGLCQGIDAELVERWPNANVQGLGEWVTVPCTYAGGANHISDLALVDKLSNGKVDLTFGSSLDIFGGKTVKYAELVELTKLA